MASTCGSELPSPRSFHNLLAKRLSELQTCLLEAHEQEVDRRLRIKERDEKHKVTAPVLPGSAEEVESQASTSPRLHGHSSAWLPSALKGGRERSNSSGMKPMANSEDETRDHVAVDAWGARSCTSVAPLQANPEESMHSRAAQRAKRQSEESLVELDAWKHSAEAEAPPRLEPQAPTSMPSVLDGGNDMSIQDVQATEFDNKASQHETSDSSHGFSDISNVNETPRASGVRHSLNENEDPTNLEDLVSDLRELRFEARDEVHIVSRQGTQMSMELSRQGTQMSVGVIPSIDSQGNSRGMQDAVTALGFFADSELVTQSCDFQGRPMRRQKSNDDGTRSEGIQSTCSAGFVRGMLSNGTNGTTATTSKPQGRRRSFSAISSTAGTMAKSMPGIFKRRISFSNPMGSTAPSQASEDERETKPALTRGNTSMSMTSQFVYEIDPAWRVERSETGGRRSSTMRLQRNTTQMFKDLQTLQTHIENSTFQSDTAEKLKKMIQRFWLHPHSLIGICWHILSFLLIGLDIVFIPLQVFQLPDEWWMHFLAWFSRVFWTADIFLSFITAYIKSDGELETSKLRIAKRYARTWLLLDLVVVTFEWLEVIIYDNEAKPHTFAKSFLFVRGLQGMRAVRLLRLARSAENFSEFLRMLLYFVRSEELKILVGIVKIQILVAVFIHCIACLWYGTGRAGNMATSWIVVNELDGELMGHRYAASFHWSMAQFTGTDSVVPGNYIERVVAILILFPAYVISAFLISSITSSMTRLQILSANTSKQLSILHRYLEEHGISTALASRVQRNTKHYIDEQRRHIPESSVELLNVLSKPLRVELDYEVHSPVMMAHPFFAFYAKKNPAGMRQLCHAAVARLFLTKDDVLFSDGEIPAEPRMFFLIRGRMLYRRKGKPPFELCPGQWACEPVLWLSTWAHHGGMSAATECNLLCLNAEEFRKVTNQFILGPIFYCGIYASEFVKAVNAFSESTVSEIYESNGINIAELVELVAESEAAAKISSSNRASHREK